MTSVFDVVRKKKCVDADRVPCEKARTYLEKKGLICDVKAKKPKIPLAKKKSKGLFEEWFG
jgi:hypothetical protein